MHLGPVALQFPLLRKGFAARLTAMLLIGGLGLVGSGSGCLLGFRLVRLNVHVEVALLGEPRLAVFAAKRLVQAVRLHVPLEVAQESEAAAADAALDRLVAGMRAHVLFHPTPVPQNFSAHAAGIRPLLGRTRLLICRLHLLIIWLQFGFRRFFTNPAWTRVFRTPAVGISPCPIQRPQARVQVQFVMIDFWREEPFPATTTTGKSIFQRRRFLPTR